MMVLFRFHFLSFSCGKQSRYSLSISIPSAVPIISTLLFQIIIFERYSRSKIKNDKTFSFASDSVVVEFTVLNYCSTILHVRVRTKYTEVNILKKEVAIKLNIQLASSLNLIWRSVVSLAFFVRLVHLYL